METIRRVTESEPVKKVGTFLDEFKNFAFKGNVVDLAVGVIIGTAFANVVASLSKNLMMPLISAIVPGNGDYTSWVWVINHQEVKYGAFIGDVLNFLLVSLVLFVFAVKFVGWLAKFRRKETAPASPAALTKEQELLTEIRDLLKRGTPG